MGIVYPFVCAVLFFTSCSAYNFVCESGWGYRHEDYCYKKFLDTSTNWESAQGICQRNGGYLVGIRDRSKQNHVQGLAAGVGHLWTGGNDRRREGQWYWDEGDSLSPFNWDSHEPSNSGNEDCLELRSEHSWLWNDESCGQERPFICELHACHLPEHCVSTTCSRSDDYQCTKCQDEQSSAQYSIYWPTPNKKVCEATCSWKENWCWPGVCGDYLAKNCRCSDGFVKSSTDPARCQLSKKPHILTCRLGAESDKGVVGNSTSHGDCEKEGSTYINFQPKSLSFKFVMLFEMPKNLPSTPIHIDEYHFGVVHSEVRVFKENLNQRKSILHTEHLTNESKCTANLDDLHPKPDSPIECSYVLFNQSSWFLKNGERLCLSYKANSGGYMRYKNFDNHVFPPVTYNRVTASKDVCLLFDSSPPVHCSENSSCPGVEPILMIPGRVTRDETLMIKMQGWKDPYLSRPDQASGIKSYVITVHDTKEVDNLTLTMDEKALQTYNVSHGEVSLTLPREPALYGISVEILDHAGNVKSARRFVMFDNSSEILINHDKRLKVYSASSQTNFTWQTHKGKTCFSWKNRYYNSYNYGYNLLRKIQKDYHGEYRGVYEQNDGILPVSGTANVFGIVSFYYSWFKEGREMSSQIPIPHFPTQYLCTNFSVKDGETHTVTLTSKDLMENTLSENVTFYIDASVPDIEYIWLKKDGVRQLFVHNSTDLSRMLLEFKTFDSHSGLHSIEYFLGTSRGGNELAYKTTAVQALDDKACSSIQHCYCPSVGLCENSVYNIEFNHLIRNNTDIGQHNKEYYFTVKVTNKARLVSIQHVDILSDDSPPVKGVVVEGDDGYPDIDYTSEDSVNVRWSGFIDHESGIMKYRLSISDHCLTLDEMDAYSHDLPKIHDTYESLKQFLKIDLPLDGLYFISVIAYNNALEPSDVACSDGITRDSSPARINDIVLQTSKAKSVVGCFDNKAWYIQENLTAFELENTGKCKEICNGSISMPLVQYLPKHNRYANHSAFSDNMCSKFPVFSENWFIYLPSDKIKLTWMLEEQESQIHSVHVGFGSTATSSALPDLISYLETDKFNEYHKIHSGLNLGTPTFAFIQIINKAGLETTVRFGPIIIDETPPVYRGKLNVFVEPKDVVVAWSSDTFLEAEEREPIHSLLFRIGGGQTIRTPYLEARIDENCPRNFSACFRYPLNRVYRLNSGDGLKYYFQIYVYNTAGHFVETRTDSFQIPARYPPTSGTLIEMDSEHSLNGADVDFIFQNNKICFEWNGLWHTQTISLEIGLGLSKDVADVLFFRNITNYTKCLYNLKLSPFNTYYTFARATVGHHSTVIMSDGFTVIDNSSILNSFSVQSGTPCRSRPNKHSVNITNTSNSLSVESILRETRVYTIVGDKNNLVSDDVVWINSLQHQFVPVIPNPSFYATNAKNLHNVSILSCQEGKQFQTSKHTFDVLWTIDDDKANFVTHYRGGLFKRNNDGLDTLVEPLKALRNISHFQFSSLNLQGNQAYYAYIQPCFQKTCLHGKSSESVVIEDSVKSLRVIEASMIVRNYGKNEVVDVNLNFDTLNCGASGRALRYATAMFDTHKPKNQITPWIPFSPDSLLDNMNHNLTIVLPIYGHKKMDICVKGICRSGQSITSCKHIDVLSNPNEYPGPTLYEIDFNSKNYQNIAKLANSQFFGDKLQLIHDSEIDVTSSDTKIYGFFGGRAGESIQWYLMKKPSLPKLACDADLDCLQSSESTDGIGRFNTQQLQPNKKYFICAFTENSSLSLENTLSHLVGVSQCGNGFVIDDSPPIAGNVDILSSSQEFILNSKELEIHWSGFSDIEMKVKDVKPGILRYEICIGSYQGGQDVLQFRNVGLQTSFIISDLNLTNGMTYFATVKAFDWAGHVTAKSSSGKTLDVTPPKIGKISVGNHRSKIGMLSTDDLSVNWEGFLDEESGVKEFYMGIGSTNTSTDILDFISVDGEFAEIKDLDSMVDGYQYYVILKTVNHADLYTITSSEAFMFDRSPPQHGLVEDGLKGDVDFQNDTRKYTCHWSGFDDPHTGIQHYEVCIGTKPFICDVYPSTNVGLHTDFTWSSIFEPGTKYFAMIKACNPGGVCDSVSSNGVIMDDSPPIPGLVHVGLSGFHEPFIPHNNSISASWVGFVDPHSDISHFEWCLGTSSGHCELVNFENVMLSSRVTKMGLQLPSSVDLYFTLRAFNRVGFSTLRTSAKFQIDISPPVLIQKPEFITSYHGLSLVQGTQFDNSLITVQWRFQDLESSIVRHFVVLELTGNGHVVFENKEIGSETQITITSPNATFLRDGDSYTAKVTSCNGAGLCTTAKSAKLLVDSSPPSLGGFMNPMSWYNMGSFTMVSLAWYGFIDVDSGVQNYLISVSESYSGDELSNGSVSVQHSSNFQQTLTLNLSKKLNGNDIIVLTVAGINNVGLKSAVGKASVILVPNNNNKTQGFLALQRYSCVSHYCNNDCTCAVIGKKCIKKIYTPCTELQNVSKTMLDISVHFGLYPLSSGMTASSSCLSGFWERVGELNRTVMRYEWTVGESGDIPGSGIFDPTKEVVWKDVGISQTIVYCLPQNKRLHHGHRYTLYVKAWVSESEFAVFSSKPVLVDITPPQIRRGRSVIESDDHCVSDIDFIHTSKKFSVCWKALFSEGQGEIFSYELSGGTRPYGDDFIPRASLNLSTFMEVNQTMVPGTRYFFTIVAKNNLGLETTAVSDGILVDTDRPIPGTVYNTKHFRNRLFQSSNSTLSTSWHGFDDHQSSVEFYEVGVYEDDSDVKIRRDESVSLSTRFTFSNLTLKHDRNYHIKVRAFDAMLRSSPYVKSYPIKIDLTPPYGVQCQSFEESVFKVSSIMKHRDVHGLQNTIVTGLFTANKSDIFKIKVRITGESHFNTLKMHIGNETMVLYMTQNVDSTSSVEHQFLSIYDGYVDVRFTISSRQNIPDESILVLLEHCNLSVVSASPLMVRQISPGILSICSFVSDPESDIQDFLIGAGTTRGGYQVRSLASFSNSNHGVIETDAPHGSRIHLTAMARNYAGLLSTFQKEITLDYTAPILGNLTVDVRNIQIEDDIEIAKDKNESIYENTTLTKSSESPAIHAGSKTEVVVTWNIKEDESELLSCYCASGPVRSFGSRVWQISPDNVKCKLSNLTFEHGTIISVAVRCVNKVQLMVEEMAGPFTIYHEPPKVTRASLSFYPNNRYTGVGEDVGTQVQANMTGIDFYWDGFEDEANISRYETRVRKNQVVIAPWRSVGLRNSASQTITSAKAADTVVVDVRAVNDGGFQSQMLNASIILDNRPPSLTGASASLISNGGSQSIRWSKVFSPSRYGSTIYQVSAGSTSGSSDLQSPISTLAEEVRFEWTSDSSQHQIFVNVLAFAPNGEFSRYHTMFYV